MSHNSIVSSPSVMSSISPSALSTPTRQSQQSNFTAMSAAVSERSTPGQTEELDHHAFYDPSTKRRSLKPLSNRFNSKKSRARASCNLPEPLLQWRPTEDGQLKEIEDESESSSEASMRPIEYEAMPEVVVHPQAAHAPLSPRAPPPPPSGQRLQVPAPVYGQVQGQQGYSAPASMGYRKSENDTVTPLHMLGAEPDTIDCPFCLRRCETRVVKKVSKYTHLWSVSCMPTIIGTLIPYIFEWSNDTEHYCRNCRKKVARRHGAFMGDDGEVETYGPTFDTRQMSQYPVAGGRTQVPRGGR